MKRIMNGLIIWLTLLFFAVATALVSCKPEESDAVFTEEFEFLCPSTVSASSEAQTLYIKIRTNQKWDVTVSKGGEWASCTGGYRGDMASAREFTLNVRLSENKSGFSRTAALQVRYGDKGSKESIDIVQNPSDGLKPCTVTEITDDIIFSTVPAGTSTSVQQGFDFNPSTDMMYFSQVTSGYKNTVSWTPRKQITASTTVASNKMILYYFSHGNNIRYEKGRDGADYLWIANYGTRDSEDKYTNPQILSRIRLVKGKTMRNTEAEENFYFGTKTIHASFDVENDQIAIYSQKDGYTMRIFRLSEVLNAPVRDITLPVTLKYGGGTSKVAPDPEWKGKPVVRAHDCTGLKPLHTFVHNYTAMGRGWQTYCIYEGKAYFFNFYSNGTNGMKYQSVMDVVSYNGKVLKSDILQPFADNLSDLMAYGFTDSETRYMENEGILIRDGVLYLLYTAKNSTGFRRPVVFNFDLDKSCL